PSNRTMSAPTDQPSSDCGPAIAAINRGIVMKGPTPTMLAMLRAVAWSRPKPRVRCGGEGAAGGFGSMIGAPRFVGLRRRRAEPISAAGSRQGALFLAPAPRPRYDVSQDRWNAAEP